MNKKSKKGWMPTFSLKRMKSGECLPAEVMGHKRAKAKAKETQVTLEKTLTTSASKEN